MLLPVVIGRCDLTVPLSLPELAGSAHPILCYFYEWTVHEVIHEKGYLEEVVGYEDSTAIAFAVTVKLSLI